MSLRDLLVMESKGMVYLPVIQDYLLKKHEEERQTKAKSTKPKGVYPSGSSHPCLRNLYYQFHKRIVKPKPIRTLLRLDVGNSMHDRYHKYAKDAGILVVKEMRLNNKEYRVRARLDQLVLIQERLRLIELKSMETDKYDRMMGRPYDDNFSQIQFYMWLLNDMFKRGSKCKVFKLYPQCFPLTEGSIVIENCNDQRTEEFCVPYDDAFMSRMLTRVKEMLACVDRNETPPRGFAKDDRECTGCNYKDTCWAEQDQSLFQEVLANGDTANQP